MKNLIKPAALMLLFAILSFIPPIETEPTFNKPPVAIAGPNKTIPLPNNSILLDGSASKMIRMEV